MGNRNVWEKSFENEGLCIRESFKKRIPKQERIKVCSRGKVRTPNGELLEQIPALLTLYVC